VTKGKIEMADGKTITIEFFDDAAPGTVANFVKLAKSGFYDGLTFHRVIPGFVAQGGCPIGNGTGGPGYTIKCETAGNKHKHLRGAVSMAHAGKDTGGSQFFICYDAFPHLDGVHTVFGQVTAGMEAVDQIKAGDKIKSITIE
jgi:peptidyl-prolyl cis-trans isomerase B (cyclophilin B)